jgi:hypothetical protein
LIKPLDSTQRAELENVNPKICSVDVATYDAFEQMRLLYDWIKGQ